MRVILIAITVAALSGAALGQTSRPTTGPAAQPAIIAELIRQLSSSDWKARQEAQDKLVAMGPDAAGALRELRANTNDEVRTRAEAALRQIAQEDLTEPTRVTLTAKDRPAEEVLTELCRQAGVAIDQDSEDGKKKRVSVDFRGEPFWLAVREVCRQAGTAPRDIIVSRLWISPDSSGWAVAPAVWSKNVLIVALELGQDRKIQLGTGRKEGEGYLQFDVQSDPKAGFYVDDIRFREVKDDKGNSLLKPKNREKDDDEDGPFGPWHRHTLHIRDLKAGGNQIAVMSGTLDAMLYQVERWEIDDPVDAKPRARTTSVGRYAVSAVRKLGRDECEVEASIPSKVEQLNPDGNPEAEPDLQDKNGNSWKRQFVSYSDENGEHQRTLTLKYHRPEQGGPPAKLVWLIVAKSQKVSVPFEFKDLPLP